MTVIAEKENVCKYVLLVYWRKNGAAVIYLLFACWFIVTFLGLFIHVKIFVQKVHKSGPNQISFFITVWTAKKHGISFFLDSDYFATSDTDQMFCSTTSV